MERFDLTPREAEVLDTYVMEGTTKKAAKRLGLQEQTVKNHLAHIRRKVGTSNTLQAVYKILTS